MVDLDVCCDTKWRLSFTQRGRRAQTGEAAANRGRGRKFTAFITKPLVINRFAVASFAHLQLNMQFLHELEEV